MVAPREGKVIAMLSTRLKISLVVLVLVALASPDAPAQRVPDGGRAAPRGQGRGLVKSIDAKAGTLTLSLPAGRDREAVEKTYTLAKNVEVGTSGGGSGRGVLLKEMKLTDLAAGIMVTLTLSADEKTVEFVLAE